MLLSDLKKGRCGTIISINSDKVLKARFASFGISKGAIIYIIEHTMSKNTIEVRVHNTKIAVRTSEAKTILIEERQCEI